MGADLVKVLVSGQAAKVRDGDGMGRIISSMDTSILIPVPSKHVPASIAAEAKPAHVSEAPSFSLTKFISRKVISPAHVMTVTVLVSAVLMYVGLMYGVLRWAYDNAPMQTPFAVSVGDHVADISLLSETTAHPVPAGVAAEVHPSIDKWLADTLQQGNGNPALPRSYIGLTGNGARDLKGLLDGLSGRGDVDGTRAEINAIAPPLWVPGQTDFILQPVMVSNGHKMATLYTTLRIKLLPRVVGEHTQWSIDGVAYAR